jgi:hypothetical protein
MTVTLASKLQSAVLPAARALIEVPRGEPDGEQGGREAKAYIASSAHRAFSDFLQPADHAGYGTGADN